MIDATAAWHAAYPDAVVGVLALRGLTNPPHHPALDAVADALEEDLHARLGGRDRNALGATPPLPAYAAHYKRFGQRYHVALQLASVAQKGEPIPRASALVTAMFVAELRGLILTAGHDLDATVGSVRLDVGSGDEPYATPAGAETAVKAGDMYTADDRGVLSAVVTGPAAAARITPATTAALFVAYAPAGVPPEAVAAHLDELATNARLVAPAATTETRAVVVGGV